MILGIDEAGRGPVIGPMVVAGVLINEEKVTELLNLGVKDSKRLAPAKRRQLAPEIERIAAKHVVMDVDPKSVDESVSKRGRLWKLNYLEAQTMAKVIASSSPDVAFVDSCDVNPERFANTIRSCLPENMRELEIVSEHKADAKYPVVAAASILAKVRRDEHIYALEAKYGALGSGYAHDPRTLRFLSKWYEEKSGFPEFVRKSWETSKQVRRHAEQTSLKEFSAGARQRMRAKRAKGNVRKG